MKKSELKQMIRECIQEILESDIPKKHQTAIAKKTLKMPDAMVGVMGGPNKKQAKDFLKSTKPKKEASEPKAVKGRPEFVLTSDGVLLRRTGDNLSDHETVADLRKISIGSPEKAAMKIITQKFGRKVSHTGRDSHDDSLMFYTK